jgi:DNA-binding transcriptional regulator YiaG
MAEPDTPVGGRPLGLGITRGDLERWLLATTDMPPEQIHGLRQHLGLTQQELARWLGLSEATVSLWEAGRRRPRGPAHRLLRLIAELSRQEPPGGTTTGDPR